MRSDHRVIYHLLATRQIDSLQAERLLWASHGDGLLVAALLLALFRSGAWRFGLLIPGTFLHTALTGLETLIRHAIAVVVPTTGGVQ